MTYEYRCRKCDTAFDVIATVAEKAAGLEPKCPKCGSKQTAQIFGAIGVLSGTSGPGGGPMCDPGMGAGCC
ncbi:MAG: zinc ribbon domain-containing protein [Spirochaetaceae bacterium]|nr:MAG: zinc ribbon domain-containing protein [Spirochaetaceae bacterium]